MATRHDAAPTACPLGSLGIDRKWMECNDYEAHAPMWPKRPVLSVRNRIKTNLEIIAQSVISCECHACAGEHGKSVEDHCSDIRLMSSICTHALERLDTWHVYHCNNSLDKCRRLCSRPPSVRSPSTLTNVGCSHFTPCMTQ